MKKLLLIFTLLFSLSSYAEWTAIVTTDNATFYGDLENINVSDGFVYYWSLINYIKPTQQGHLSQKSLLQIDCKKPRRFKIVSDSFYKMPMGIGKTDMFATSHDLLAAGFSWNFSPPNSAIDGEIENVCNLVTK